MKGALRIEAAEKTYDPGGAAVLAVDGVTLDIAPGEFCSVVGPSGCGKTTLLNAIAGFDGLTGGTIHLDGALIASPDRSATPGADRIVVFQNGALFPWRTVLWNVTSGPVMQGRASRAEADELARELLRRAGLDGVETKYPDELSGGQKRRVEIVRALINDPTVLLLDEPFRALDALTKSVMQEYLMRLLAQVPKTVFFITHDLEEALFLGDTVVVLTSRPAQIKKVIEVDIPKPRNHEVLSSDRFLELKSLLDDEIHQEAVKSFQTGEKELAT
jgi:NitT/TauT family transport system ATP-binding protein